MCFSIFFTPFFHSCLKIKTLAFGYKYSSPCFLNLSWDRTILGLLSEWIY